ncbi:hypothetical protein [Sinomicrobium weinanense]|uniref:Uncharacterized protein n=1 Tax=Sinomicrobium weinanense TaxID=2842200 RepID=A0A926JQY0_9FLAO|nr:hypothetical protein [Sinomicrobium weinanense]MBC9795860.1 hypothetical protein [Sinomicrobium weinanense]MBU3125380.1 hypothetical protein [Sinomicrobium weinanense]
MLFAFALLGFLSKAQTTHTNSFAKEITVNNTVMVELTDETGNPLNVGSIYKVRLVTRGTGTNTGAEYLVWYNPDASVWNLRAVTLAGDISNHPLLTIDNNVVKVKTNHSNNYRIRVFIQELQMGESDVEPDVFGPSYHWQRKGNGLFYTDGRVGIGTTDSSNWKLAVNGNIRAKEVKVETGWSDFVFEENYPLPTLEEVEQHIIKKGHLKDIPSAKEVEENGIFLGEMDAKLLQKIEELTLYIIKQQKVMKIQGEAIQELKKEIEQLKKNQ